MCAPSRQSQLPALLNNFSRIGKKNDTGIERLALSDTDRDARQKLLQIFRENSLHSYTDNVGNVFGLVNPTSDEEPLILMGSHLDSQPDGGRFDGQVGVLAAVLAVCRLRDAGDIPAGVNLGVVNWTNEEGARFQPSVMGSSTFTGQLDVKDALNSVDHAGLSVAEELERLGIAASESFPGSIAAYAELHVEQGRILDDEDINIGIVEGTWAAYKTDLEVHGVQTHTGPTSMKDRVDAMYGAARLITFIHEMGLNWANGLLHTSVAWADIYPNSPNATPSRVRLKVELRSKHESIIRDAQRLLDDELRLIEKQAGVHCLLHEWSERPAGKFRGFPISEIESVLSKAGLSHRRMLTIAGHDAVVTNAADIPTVLLFIPSHCGITHNSGEFTSDADLANGDMALTAVAKYLLATVAAKAAVS